MKAQQVTAEEHIAFQLCVAMDVEPTQKQWGDLVGVLVRYKHGQKIATSHLERELTQTRGDRAELHNGLAVLLGCIEQPAKIAALRPQLDELVARTAPTV